MTKDYFAIFGLLPTAEDIVVKAAYKALAQRYHPDKFRGDPGIAKAKMEELNEAYHVLSDQKRRQAYIRERMNVMPDPDGYFAEWLRAFVDARQKNWD